MASVKDSKQQAILPTAGKTPDVLLTVSPHTEEGGQRNPDEVYGSRLSKEIGQRPDNVVPNLPELPPLRDKMQRLETNTADPMGTKTHFATQTVAKSADGSLPVNDRKRLVWEMMSGYKIGPGSDENKANVEESGAWRFVMGEVVDKKLYINGPH